MEKHADYSIKKRKDGRYAVVKRGGGHINGLDKTKVLVEAGLIKVKLPAPAPELTEEANTSTEAGANQE